LVAGGREHRISLVHWSAPLPRLEETASA
jgi:hypothetical protein